jgi:hypothetical protein
MDPVRWQRIKELLHQGLARPQGERDAFLDEACAGNTTLRHEVESLLAQQRSTHTFLQKTALT